MYLRAPESPGPSVPGRQANQKVSGKPSCSLRIALAVRILEVHKELGRCEGIGIGVPGMLDAAGTGISLAPRLGWRDVPLRDLLVKETGGPGSGRSPGAQPSPWRRRRGPARRGPPRSTTRSRPGSAAAASFISGEIIAAWDLLETTVRQALATRVLAPAASSIEITAVLLPDHPRLRGAAALVTAPLFAAPTVG